MSATEAGAKTIRSTIPARLDRLSWSPFHTRMVAGDITKPLTATEESAVVAAPATP